MIESENVENRQAFVKITLVELANALFGPGLKVTGVVTTPTDQTTETVSVIVADHESLPVLGPGDTMTCLVAEVHEHGIGIRTTEFRAFEPKRH